MLPPGSGFNINANTLLNGNRGTALFIDSINPVDRNFEKVLEFVTKGDVVLNPLPEIQLFQGKYHR